jgi:hypothetical protein
MIPASPYSTALRLEVKKKNQASIASLIGGGKKIVGVVARWG